MSLNKAFIDFYANYFINYWELRLKILNNEIENKEVILAQLKESNEFSTVPKLNVHYETLLNFDLHALKYHIIETENIRLSDLQ
ncbi:MAG: hypothetical protein ACE5OZ_25200 [Candidatus Heimdallarchaeota archaeon]